MAKKQEKENYGKNKGKVMIDKQELQLLRDSQIENCTIEQLKHSLCMRLEDIRADLEDEIDNVREVIGE